MKFRCSDLDTLMTKSRSKSDPISKTAMKKIREYFIKRDFGREKMVLTKYMIKGVEQEPVSIDLYNEVFGTKLNKNQKELENDFITGTPDLVGDEIIDIKTSWDIWTFDEIDKKIALNDYKYQVLGYMWLTGIKKGKLAYCLVDMPEHMFVDEMYKLSFSYKNLTQSELEEKFYYNYHFGDIAPEKKVKTFEVEWNEEEIENIKNKITLAREALERMKL